MDKRKKNALFALLSLIGMALFVFMLFELYTLREYRTSEEVFLENGVRWQLGYAPNIRSLDICDNSGTFPSILSKLPNLTVLRLTSEKPFRPEDKDFEHVKQLNHLYLSAPSIDIASTRLYDIKIIMLEPLETGEIPDIPEDSKVKNLFILAGGLSKLPHIPPHTLEVLRISGTTLEDFSGICVPGIKSLCIENNPHAQWQKNVAQMNELGSLTWRNNALDHYPQELSELTKLTSLSLSKNNITAIPETAQLPPKLKLLYLNNNALAALPADFFKGIPLDSLQLHGNRLTALPQVMPIHLREIDLSGNPLEDITPLNTLNNLEEVTLPESQRDLLDVETIKANNPAVKITWE